MSTKDQINTAAPRESVECAYFIASQLQGRTAANQVLGVAILLLALAEQIGLDKSQLLNQAERITTDADTYYTREVKALRDYIKGELK